MFDFMQEVLIILLFLAVLAWMLLKLARERREEAERVSNAPVTFDLIQHLRRQWAFSQRTFGPGPRTSRVLEHIRKELSEVEAAPEDPIEWADVLLLTFDGAMRAGHSPEAICQALIRKLAINEQRTWPDWRTADPTRPLEHIRAGAE